MGKDVLFLNLTNDCNLMCDYCWQHKTPDGMSRDTMLKSLEYFLALNKGEELLCIDFFNGESMLKYDLIKEAIGYCRKYAPSDKKLSFNILTNGTLFNEERLNFFENQPELNLTISLYGDEETHNQSRRYRNGKGSWKDVIKYIDRLVNMNTFFSVVISPNMIDKLVENVRSLYALGCKKLILQFAIIKSGWNEKEMEIAKNELRRLVHFYLSEVDRDSGLEIFIIDYMIKALQRRDGMDVPCAVGHLMCNPLKKRRSIAISPDGKIYPCSGLASTNEDDFCIGDIKEGIDPEKEESFYEKITFPELSKIYSQESCKNCENRDFCWRGCSAMRYSLFNDMFFIKGQRFACELYKLLFEEVKRTFSALSHV